MRQEILRVRHADAQHRVRRERCDDEPQQLRQIGADVVSVGARVLRREPHLHNSLCTSAKRYMVTGRFEVENGPAEGRVKCTGERLLHALDDLCRAVAAEFATCVPRLAVRALVQASASNGDE